MTQRLQIKNFGAIREADIEVFPLTVFIGPHASGKSTLAKLIHFFREVKDEYFKILQTHAEKAVFDPAAFYSDFNDKIGNDFLALAGDIRGLDTFKVIFYYANDFRLAFANTEKGNLMYGFSGEKAKSLEEKALKIIEKTQKSEIENKAKQAFLQAEVNRLFNYEKSEGLFIPANRAFLASFGKKGEKPLLKLLAQAAEAHPFPDFDVQAFNNFATYTTHLKHTFAQTSFDSYIAQEKNSELQELLATAYTHIQSLLGGGYVQDNGKEYFTSQGTTPRILAQAATSQKEIVRILQDLFLLLQGKIQAFRTIEEPEAHLYPQAQKELMELIAFVIQHSKTDFVLTTHSPYVLSIINVLLLGGRLKGMEAEGAKDIVFSLNPEDIAVYNIKLEEGWSIENVITNRHLIGDNNLDSASYSLMDDFNAHMHLYRTHRKKGGEQ